MTQSARVPASRELRPVRLCLLCALVLLAVVVATSVEATTFTVNHTGETQDSNPGDGSCDDGSGNCTLVAAIEEVNGYNSDTPHTIEFAALATSFQLSVPLPQISREGTVVDGWAPSSGFTSGGSPVVTISGESAGVSPGLDVGRNNITIRGLKIYGFQGTGIVIEVGVTGTVIRGCYIGTNGVTDLGNSEHGIYVGASSNNIIGGTGVDDGNVIAGNTSAGIYIDGNSGAATGNVILGNLIGLNAAGAAAMANQEGVVISQANAHGNTVGGDTTGARNVISGNTNAGVTVVSGASGNVIRGNYIGTNGSGSAAVPNGLGVHLLQGAATTAIGGGSSGQGNVISGNTGTGITITGGSVATTVMGNLIGVSADGSGALGNGSHGIYAVSAPDVTIGGATPGEANVIAHNGGAGVVVDEPAPCVLKHISGNSIRDNGALGIDLGDDGVTANDPGDGDTGPNNLQNFPVLTSAMSRPGQLAVAGTLDSAPSADFRLEFFASPLCDASGHGEGAVYLGSTDAATDGSGNASFDITLPVSVAAGSAITATATDSSGNTSEFSACLVAAGGGAAVPALDPLGIACALLLLTAVAAVALKRR